MYNLTHAIFSKQKVVWLFEEDTLSARACFNTKRMDPRPPMTGMQVKGIFFPAHKSCQNLNAVTSG